MTNEDLGRDAHWFDGDGMLCGVSFTRVQDHGGNHAILPEFVNQYILTDVYLASQSLPLLRRPIVPSITTLVNPFSSLITIILAVFRTISLVILSFLAGSKQAIRKISVTNTSVYYHDGRALAGCESGPPMRIALPGLETVGWFDGHQAEGEPRKSSEAQSEGFGGDGLIGFMKEWTTAHPKVDQATGEMILFHSMFVPPYVHYSVVPGSKSRSLKPASSPRLLNVPLQGVKSAKMMHDFGVSPTHTVIMDLPLSLDPLNLAKGRPVVEYDTTKPSRFGIFPRRSPSDVRWFETSACCIFHTANTWDTIDVNGHVSSINLLSCRLTSAFPVFGAGNLPAPIVLSPKSLEEPIQSEKPVSFFDSYDSDEETDEESRLLTQSDQHIRHTPTSLQPDSSDEINQSHLYYHSFSLNSPSTSNTITHQFPLAAIPFEFPSVRKSAEMSAARYIYGCSTTVTTAFGTALGRAVKIDALVKMDAEQLIARGTANPSRSLTECVDTRNIHQILDSKDPEDPIKVFRMPEGWFAQEPRFVARNDGTREDDGFLLTYAFDESQLLPSGECPANAKSELWVLDASDMQTVVCRVRLPQRVPYGLHGNWFSEEEILGQREVERVRTTEHVLRKDEERSALGKLGMRLRRWAEGCLA